ncbi:MAG: 2TM domain-containing protein [Bacteroidia bacterium]|nr:2TM domain-containing protein [Bacteroidia bacterium]
MSRRKYRNRKRKGRIKGFKIHFMNYLGVMGFLWFIYFFTNAGGYPWPVWPMAGWGLGLFFHYVGAVMAPGWSEDEEEEEKVVQASPEIVEEKISSEYRMDDMSSERRRRSSQESWDGVDVQVHDVDDNS